MKKMHFRTYKREKTFENDKKFLPIFFGITP